MESADFVIDKEQKGAVLLVHLAGRLDAYWAEHLESVLKREADVGNRFLVLDFDNVTYVSSRAISAIVAMRKLLLSRNGFLRLASLNEYVRGVFQISRLDGVLEIFPSVEDAVGDGAPSVGGRAETAAAEVAELSSGTFSLTIISEGGTTARVTGSVQNILSSACGPADVVSASANDLGYSLGIGGLGMDYADYAPRIGEMMTLGGCVVWLPTGSRSAPDFMIPADAHTPVTVNSMFNLSFGSDLGLLIEFKSHNDHDGSDLRQVYEDLMDLVADRLSAFRGALGVAMRAETVGIYGASLRRSPIRENAPHNGCSITHANNIKEWLSFHIEPEYRNKTSLMVGILVNRQATENLSPKAIDAAFSITNEESVLSHAHAAVFEQMSRGRYLDDINAEIDQVVRNGHLIGIEHLLNSSTISWARMGVTLIDDFVISE